jgi:hypothetical protein
LPGATNAELIAENASAERMFMLFFWLIPLVILAFLAVALFLRRVKETSPARSDSDVLSTGQAEREERNQNLR